MSHSGRGTRLPRKEPPPLPLSRERCYCNDLRLPYVHTLGDHRPPQEAH